MKVSTQLTNVLKQACKEVNAWDQWQRSLDPHASQNEDISAKSKSRKSTQASALANKTALRQR
jgi:hypothetical protein